MRRMMSPDELAEYVGVAKQTLANWRVMKVGPTLFKIGRLVRYWEADVDQWLASGGGATSESE
ncbi:helix-turn-helix transcriptional regulator [Herbiconiux sp. A18JL235]|uniref:Helix-turn-helix transcriptional regulator n=1 Tax=Herbiconiux sp. A18JL235 TaxID=3152363 RepID=A0AB39BLH2_9MICO